MRLNSVRVSAQGGEDGKIKIHQLSWWIFIFSYYHLSLEYLRNHVGGIVNLSPYLI